MAFDVHPLAEVLPDDAAKVHLVPTAREEWQEFRAVAIPAVNARANRATRQGDTAVG